MTNETKGFRLGHRRLRSFLPQEQAEKPNRPQQQLTQDFRKEDRATSPGEAKRGDLVTFDGNNYVITDVQELMPPIGDFGFLHASCKIAAE